MEFISREAAITAVNSRAADFIPYLRGVSEMIPLEIAGAVVRVPSAEVRPVVHGRWRDWGEGYASCSECGETTPWLYASDYCGHCGAKMEDDNETD